MEISRNDLELFCTILKGRGSQTFAIPWVVHSGKLLLLLLHEDPRLWCLRIYEAPKTVVGNLWLASHMWLVFKTASGSLSRRQILARLPSKRSKTMNISKKRPTKVTICIIFSCYLIQIAMRYRCPIVWLSGKTIFKYEATIALSAKKAPYPCPKNSRPWCSLPLLPTLSVDL